MLRWGETRLELVIERLAAFENAGADVLYAPGLHTLESMREVCSALQCPVNAVIEMSGTPFSVAEIAETGVKRISLGAVLARTAYDAMIKAATEIRDNQSSGFAEDTIDYDRLESFFRS